MTFEDFSKIFSSKESENVKKNLFKFWIDFKLSDRKSILNFFKSNSNSYAEITDPYHKLLFKIVKNSAFDERELEEKIESYKERIKTDDLSDDEVQSILSSDISVILKLAYELEHYDIVQNILKLGNSLCEKREEGAY